MATQKGSAESAGSNKGLWGVIVFLSLLGMGFSIYLTYLHVKVYTAPGYKSVCAVSAKINCESVALSPHSVLLGIPVAVWGLIGYLLFLIVALLAYRQEGKVDEGFHGFMLVTSLFSTGVSAYYAYISHYVIKALCLFCLGTYVINPILLVLTLVLLSSDKIAANISVNAFVNYLTKNAQVPFIGGFAVLIVLFAYPKYWKDTSTWQDKAMPTGKDHGHAWIGAKAPRLTIVEYTDYQCGHCKINHKRVREVLREHKDILRVVHRHYPLDHTCHPKIKRRFHPNACLFARAAYCAGEQGKFWPMNDLLYRENRSLQKPGLLEAAKSFKMDTKQFKGCVDSAQAKKAVAKDLTDGIAAGVRGTPHFIIEGLTVPFKSKEDGLLFAKATYCAGKKGNLWALVDALRSGKYKGRQGVLQAAQKIYLAAAQRQHKRMKARYGDKAPSAKSLLTKIMFKYTSCLTSNEATEALATTSSPFVFKSATFDEYASLPQEALLRALKEIKATPAPQAAPKKRGATAPSQPTTPAPKAPTKAPATPTKAAPTRPAPAKAPTQAPAPTKPASTGPAKPAGPTPPKGPAKPAPKKPTDRPAAPTPKKPAKRPAAPTPKRPTDRPAAPTQTTPAPQR